MGSTQILHIALQVVIKMTSTGQACMLSLLKNATYKWNVLEYSKQFNSKDQTIIVKIKSCFVIVPLPI